MTRRGLVLLWILLAALAHLLPRVLPGPSLRADLPERSARTFHYEIDASLDPRTHVVEGRGRLTWRNQTSATVEDLHLHLYLNAFADRRSTFMRESGGSHRGHDYEGEHPGGIEVTRLQRVGGADLLPEARYQACDDGNPNDRTVLATPLAEPIPPGGEATFEIEWTSRLPQVFARTGFGGDFHMVAQWYPKVGVFEAEPPGGGPPRWNCHQFHATSEFFSDYGTWSVRITVPPAYEGRVGATGRQVGEPARGEDGALTYRFDAEDVHDFAWVCDTDFVVHEWSFPGGAGTAEAERDRLLALGVPAARLELTPVTVRLLLQPEHEAQAERHRQAVFDALSYMGLWFGRYPYPTLTVVDPDHRAGDAGGMEYPTLITAGTDYRIAKEGWTPQFVLIHEFGHQHFYGLLGTNEFENAWMDEGMTTWATARTLMAAWPPRTAHLWYAGLPVRGERALDFPGWLATAPRAFPWAVPALRDDVRVPFGRLAPVAWLARRLGTQAPDTIGLWPDHGEASPLSFLREVPPLTLLEPRPLSVREAERIRQASADLVDPIVGTFAWRHLDGGSYGLNSYRRTANALRTLEGLVGEKDMLAAMRTYAERYRFGHPTPDDFFAVVRDTAGTDVGWYLDAAFRTTKDLDFGVDDIEARPLHDEKDQEEHTVVVRRHGEMRFPTTILVRFEDGSRQLLRWELDDTLTVLEGGVPPERTAPPRAEQGRWVGLRYGPDRPVRAAEVDPFRQVDLDGDRTNDGRRRERGASVAGAVALRVLGWVEMTTSFYGGL